MQAADGCGKNGEDKKDTENNNISEKTEKARMGKIKEREDTGGSGRKVFLRAEGKGLIGSGHACAGSVVCREGGCLCLMRMI